jgi:AraC-like DNA-binding protein
MRCGFTKTRLHNLIFHIGSKHNQSQQPTASRRSNIGTLLIQKVESLYSKIQVVVDFITANLHRKLSLDELARSAKISRYHLCHLFKAKAGMSPGQYIQKLRMQEASMLLATTLMSVKQIMIEIGYSDKSLFVRHFKKAQGLTPSEYRAKHLDLTLVKDYRPRQDHKS